MGAGMNSQRVTLISDLHGWLPELPGGDLLVIAGDFCPIKDHGIERQKSWVSGPFEEWLVAQPYENIVGIAGNHDFIAEGSEGSKILRSLSWEYLQDESRWIGGMKIWGSPWCAPCGRWAFMAGENDLESRWAEIPQDTDLVITHSPAHGWGDRVMSGERVGSETLFSRLQEVRPALHVHGHIHEARASGRFPRGIPTINASLLDERYEPWGWCWQLQMNQQESVWQIGQISEEPLRVPGTSLPESRRPRFHR